VCVCVHVIVCDPETSTMRQSRPKLCCCATKNIVAYFSDAAKSTTSQYSVESTVTSRIANS
jgi:hypothetical protein